MDTKSRKFFYKVLAIRGEAFNLSEFPAKNYSEAIEKTINKGVDGGIPDEIRVQKTNSFTFK